MEDTNRIRDLNDRRAKVFGRISYWLENVELADDTAEAKRRIQKLEDRIAEIRGGGRKDHNGRAEEAVARNAG